MRKKSKNFYQGRYGDDNGQSELPEPSCSRVSSQKGDQIQVKPYGDAVQQKSRIDGCFGVNDCREGKDKEADTDTNNEKRPEAALEDKKVQQKAGNACGGQDNG